ncbi:MAG: hypothetical protein M0R74_04135 [Dehalococcoidia bacterium]|nr:hypothetical protein [Dehalococcoidia bacterium]
MPNEQDIHIPQPKQAPDARQIIMETVQQLTQMFPTRDEAETIAKNAVPSELVDIDRSPGNGGDVLRRGKAPVVSGYANTAPPAAYWGKAVTALKVGGTYLTDIVEFLAGEGMTGGLEGNTITFTNAGVTKLTAGDAGIVFNKDTGEISATTNPIARIAPTSGYVLTYVQVIASDESGTTLRFTGKNAAGEEGYADIVIGAGGGGSTGLNQSVTVYGRVYDFNGQLLQETWTYTYVNGALQSITAGSPHVIGNLTPCT